MKNLFLFLFVLSSQSAFGAESGQCKEIFTHYWKKNVWGGISRSGRGSDLIQTAVIREKLPLLLRKYHCQSMVDAPCGDFYWMQSVNLPLKSYIGVDVVKKLIKLNKSKFGNKNRSFTSIDITKKAVPRADLILCRDCLVHLTYAQITKALRNFKKSGSTYLLTTTFTNLKSNRDIPTGGWRPLNLMLPPFNFPPPLEVINEKCSEGKGKWSDKSLLLWRIQDLPSLSVF